MILVELREADLEKALRLTSTLEDPPEVFRGEVISGLLVQYHKLEELLDLLGVVETSRHRSKTIEGFLNLKVQKRPQNLHPDIILRRITVPLNDLMARLLNEFFDSLKTIGIERLVVTTQANQQPLEPQENEFCLRLSHGPDTENPRLIDHETVFSSLLIPERHLLEFSGKGVAIADAGSVVGGEIVGTRTVFTLFRLPREIQSREYYALRFILEATLKHIGVAEEHCFQESGRKNNQELAEVKSLLTGTISTRIEDFSKLKEEKRREIARKQAETTQAARELKELEELELETRNGLVLMQEMIDSRFSEIERIPKVKSIECKSNVFIVYTDELIGFDSRSGKYSLFGEFRFEFYPFACGDEEFFRAYNLTGPEVKVGGNPMACPHIAADGKACMGDFAEILPRAIREFRLFDAVLMAIELVEVIDTSDTWGESVNLWETVEVEKLNGIVVRRR